MKLKFFFINLILISGFAKSQILFLPEFAADDLIYLQDGNMAVLAGDQVYKISHDLSIIWASDVLPFAGYSTNSGLFEMEDGSFVAFFGSMIHTISAEGILLSSVEISPDFVLVDQSAGGFQFIKYDPLPEGIKYSKLSNSGELEWEYSIFIPDEDDYYKVKGFYTNTEHSTYIRSDMHYGPEQDSLMFTQFDTIGHVINNFQEFIPMNISSISNTTDGFILGGSVGTQYCISKRNEDGSIAWTTNTSLSDLNIVDTLSPVAETWNNDLVRAIQAYDPDAGTFLYMLQYYSADGDSLFTGPSFLESSIPYQLKKLLQVGENELAIIGNYNSDTSSQGFVILTDTIGTMLNLHLSGKVYFDQNENELYDTGEITFENIFIHSSPNPYAAVTNNDGNYSLDIYGLGVSTSFVNPVPNWDMMEPASYTNTLEIINSGDTISGQDYRLSYSFSATDASVNLYHDGIYIGIPASITGILFNHGNQTISSGSVSLKFPSFLTFNSAEPAAVSIIDTIITWDYSDLKPYETIYFTANFDTLTDPELFETPYTASVELSEIADDTDLTNNAYEWDDFVKAGYDPNHKIAVPTGIGPTGSTDPETEWLEYTIQFQNTGTATTTNVSIVDTIDSDFDLYSLQMIGASHHYIMQCTLPNIITWNFNDINLPDSTSDFYGSNGFLKYRIKLNEDAGIGTQLTNTAAIYFDYNLPVITNTTLNTLEELPQVGVEEELINNLFSIYPNPVSDELTIELLNPANKLFKAALFNINGTQLKIIHINPGANTVHLSAKELSPGIYFIRIIDFENGHVDQIPFVRN